MALFNSVIFSSLCPHAFSWCKKFFFHLYNRGTCIGKLGMWVTGLFRCTCYSNLRGWGVAFYRRGCSKNEVEPRNKQKFVRTIPIHQIHLHISRLISPGRRECLEAITHIYNIEEMTGRPGKSYRWKSIIKMHLFPEKTKSLTTQTKLYTAASVLIMIL